MNLLALDCSSRAASCALVRDGRLTAETYLDSGLTHSQTLLPAVQQMLRACSADTAALTHVAVTRGPGSFTGLRIGLATAKAIAAGLDIPVCGVSTLEALAYNLSGFEGVCCAALDARRQEFYTALFTLSGGAVLRLSPDEALPAALLERRLRALNGAPVFFVGDGAELCYNEMESRVGGLRLAPAHLLLQRAGGTAFAALNQPGDAWMCADALVPSYLRLSQAERERLAGS